MYASNSFSSLRALDEGNLPSVGFSHEVTRFCVNARDMSTCACRVSRPMSSSSDMLFVASAGARTSYEVVSQCYRECASECMSESKTPSVGPKRLVPSSCRRPLLISSSAAIGTQLHHPYRIPNIVFVLLSPGVAYVRFD